VSDEDRPSGVTIEQRIVGLNIVLPEPPSAVAMYEPCVQTGNLVYVSGMLPTRNGELVRHGKLGEAVTPDEGFELAGVCALNALAALRSHLGTLNRVRRVVRLAGYVASGPGFVQQSHVVNGASRIMNDVFGAEGRHARVAIGVAELPLDAPVEVEFLFEVAPGD
jgi:enamine deaminase RidA (YjgF/YER057c/UK114 family)